MDEVELKWSFSREKLTRLDDGDNGRENEYKIDHVIQWTSACLD